MNNQQIQYIIDIALNAGQEIMNIYNSSDFGVEIKSDNSPLTLADKAAHEVIMEGLNKTEYPVLSEEGAKTPFEERKNWKRFWMVDPLDGTKEFIKKNGEFTVNIALIENGEPIFGVVYAPVLEVLYYGLKGGGAYKISQGEKKEIKISIPKDKLVVVASRSHLNGETSDYIQRVKEKYKTTKIISKGSSLKLVLVAEGKAHLYPRFAPTMEWDTAAGHAVVVAAGGYVTKTDGSPLIYNKENLLNPYFIVSSILDD